jgi:Domain of unknown function (DUF1918)
MLPKPSRGLIASTPEEAKLVSNMVATTAARVGDAVEVKGLPGKPAKRGQIVEVLGAGEHVHFRVRWEDEHESLLFPTTEGGTLIHRPTHDRNP